MQNVHIAKLQNTVLYTFYHVLRACVICITISNKNDGMTMNFTQKIFFISKSLLGGGAECFTKFDTENRF